VKRHLLLYEDPRWERLSPVADLLPVPGLRFGASTLGERWVAALGLPLFAIEARADVLAAWREPLALAVGRPAADDEVLAVNAAALPGGWLAALAGSGTAALFVAGGEPVAARLRFGDLAPSSARARTSSSGSRTSAWRAPRSRPARCAGRGTSSRTTPRRSRPTSRGGPAASRARWTPTWRCSSGRASRSRPAPAWIHSPCWTRARARS